MTDDHKDITMHDLLAHMQNMQRVMREELVNIQKGLALARTSLTGEAREVKNMIRNSESRLTAQIDAIDARLDEIEIELLPKRIAVLEKAVGIKR